MTEPVPTSNAQTANCNCERPLLPAHRGWFCTEVLPGLAFFISVLALIVSFCQGWIARDAEQRQLRAYVLFNSAEMIAADAPGKFKISVIFKNGGQSPAYNVTRYVTGALIEDTPHKFDFSKPAFFKAYFADTPPAPTTDLISAGKIKVSSAVAFDVPSDQLQSIRSGEKAIFAGAVVKYRDTFQRCQVSAVILEIKLVLEKWIPTDLYHYTSDPEEACFEREGIKTAFWP